MEIIEKQNQIRVKQVNKPVGRFVGVLEPPTGIGINTWEAKHTELSGLSAVLWLDLACECVYTSMCMYTYQYN